MGLYSSAPGTAGTPVRARNHFRYEDNPPNDD